MKQILMMILEDCPHCHRALAMMEELKKENPAFQEVEIKMVDEKREPAFADSLDYWYVPTYFVEGKKLFEGVPEKSRIKEVFETALA